VVLIEKVDVDMFCVVVGMNHYNRLVEIVPGTTLVFENAKQVAEYLPKYCIQGPQFLLE
jgi:hypothetical protein